MPTGAVKEITTTRQTPHTARQSPTQGLTQDSLYSKSGKNTTTKQNQGAHRLLGSLSLLIFLNMTASLTRWALMRSYSSSICKQRWGEISNNFTAGTRTTKDNREQKGTRKWGQPGRLLRR